MSRRNARDERIATMLKAGMTLRAIAKKVRLTNERVRYIIAHYERHGQHGAPDAFPGLSVRLHKRLRDHGIDTPEDLIARWTASKLTHHLVSGHRYPIDFWSMPNIGPKSLAEIAQWVEARRRR